MDDERRQLEREAGQGDLTALSRLQALNDRVGLTSYDADYLSNYLALCETAIEQKWTETDALKALSELNATFQTRVGSKTLKREIATVKARKAGYDEGYDEGLEWARSSDC